MGDCRWRDDSFILANLCVLELLFAFNGPNLTEIALGKQTQGCGLGE